MAFPPTTVLHAPALTHWQTEDGLHVALDATAPRWVATDARGWRLLQLVDGRRTVAQVAHESGLAADPRAALQHATTFLEAVGRAGLVGAEAYARQAYDGRSHALGDWRLRELWLHTNDSCNLRCTHCLVSSGPDGSAGLPTERLLRVIDEAVALGAERVFLSGGEPFLRKDLAALAAHVTGHHGRELIILTNATLFGLPGPRAVLEGLDRARVRFQVSLDGTTAAENDPIRGAGTFEKVGAGATLLASLGFGTSLTVVPRRSNLAGLPGLPALARRLGVPSVHLMWGHKRGRGLDLLADFPTAEELLPVVRAVREAAAREGVRLDNVESLTSRANAVPGVKHDLGMAGVEALCLGPDGVLYPSAATVGEARLAVGVLGERPLAETWRASPVAQRLRAASLVQSPSASASPLRFLTGGGDVEHAYFWSGDVLGADPWAPLVDALTRDAIEDLARRGRARMNPAVLAQGPVVFHAMGEGALACGDEVPGAVRTLHSNCVLAFDVDRPRALVRAYYGAAAQTPREDLCCPVRPAAEDLAHIPPGVVERFYGCGSPVRDAALKPGETHLDLGSGAGIDVFIAARHVGPTGRAVGLDMTPDMLAVAREHQPQVARALGFDVVTFHQGVLERIPLSDAEVDCVTSNCVINLSPDKRAVLAETFRVLKDHGRLVFSDIVSEQPVPPHLSVNAELWGECLGGALAEDELLAELARAGFHGVEVLSRSPWRTVEGHAFFSVTVRAWRGARAQGEAQERGHTARYRGPFTSVSLESGRVFMRDVAEPVSVAEAEALRRAPYAAAFEVSGPTSPLAPEPPRACCC